MERGGERNPRYGIGAHSATQEGDRCYEKGVSRKRTGKLSLGRGWETREMLSGVIWAGVLRGSMGVSRGRGCLCWETRAKFVKLTKLYFLRGRNIPKADLGLLLEEGVWKGNSVSMDREGKTESNSSLCFNLEYMCCVSSIVGVILCESKKRRDQMEGGAAGREWLDEKCVVEGRKVRMTGKALTRTPGRTWKGMKALFILS